MEEAAINLGALQCSHRPTPWYSDVSVWRERSICCGARGIWTLDSRYRLQTHSRSVLLRLSVVRVGEVDMYPNLTLFPHRSATVCFPCCWRKDAVEWARKVGVDRSLCCVVEMRNPVSFFAAELRSLHLRLVQLKISDIIFKTQTCEECGQGHYQTV